MHDRELMRSDPKLAAVMKRLGPIEPARDRRASRPDAYTALARAICGQQLSTKAAATIWGRVEELFGGGVPAPGTGARRSIRSSCAMPGCRGRRSPTSATSPSACVTANSISSACRSSSDEEVIAELTEIKGIGRWTAEMFLIFHLGRPDVISTGDLGIRKAAQLAHGLDELPAPAELEAIGEAWRPHRTLACLYLWRSLDNAPA